MRYDLYNTKKCVRIYSDKRVDINLHNCHSAVKPFNNRTPEHYDRYSCIVHRSQSWTICPGMKVEHMRFF